MQVNAHIARKNTPPAHILAANVKNSKELQRYFEYSQSGVDVVEDGLKEITFGEFLVEQQVLESLPAVPRAADAGSPAGRSPR